jgi:uroporphyrinogen decarboxylase
MKMTGRECVLAALNHEEPDRLPVDLGGRHATMHVNAQRALKRHLNLPGGEEVFRQYWLQTVEIDPRITGVLGGDVVSFATGNPDTWKMDLDEVNHIFHDDWGAGYHMPEGGYYFDYHSHPLASAKTRTDLDAYAWPDPQDPGRVRGLRQAVEKVQRDGQKAIMMTVAPSGAWEQTWTLRGPQQALMDLVAERDLYEEILDRTVAYQLALWERVLDLVGEWIDVAALSDDLGTQDGPMISPRLFREIFKPRLAKVCALIHERSKAKAYIHTDGSVFAFLPDLIEAGIEVINPVQTECRDMDPARLKRTFGKNLTFWGAGCNTRAFEFGTPEEVRAQAKEAIRHLAPGGGYVFAAIHNIQPQVPPENIVALFETARRFGTYPIRVPPD